MITILLRSLELAFALACMVGALAAFLVACGMALYATNLAIGLFVFLLGG